MPYYNVCSACEPPVVAWRSWCLVAHGRRPCIVCGEKFDTGCPNLSNEEILGLLTEVVEEEQ